MEYTIPHNTSNQLFRYSLTKYNDLIELTNKYLILQPPSVFTPSQPQTFQSQPPPNQQFQPQQVNFQTQPIQNQNQYQQSQQQQPLATPEPPKQKAPLPEEFVYMQTVFNELRQQCVNAASNPVRTYIASISLSKALRISFLF